MEKRKEYDVIVVGSGAGGSTVAREMSIRGRKVLLVEKGSNLTIWGNTLSCAMMLQLKPLPISKQISPVIAASTYGGASVVACGAAIPPPKKIFDKVKVDLSAEAKEAKSEMWIQELPDELCGPTNMRLLEAANDLGYKWGKLEKFVDADKCVKDCSDCMLGCKRLAKWSARVYGDEAVRNGAEISFHTRISSIIHENGKAVGVEGRRHGMKVKYYGRKIVLSGGANNVGLLRRAGLSEAGRSFAVDWLQFVGAVIPGMSTVYEGSMTVGTTQHYESDGFILTPVFTPRFLTPAWVALAGPAALPWIRHMFNSTGIMVKIQDELKGEIYPDNWLYGSSKTPTEKDLRKLAKGVDVIKKILKRAGARENTILALPPSGAHPSSSCRIGEVVDSNLKTRLDNLYCCDASVIPESMGLPVVWTAVSLGKRLAKHLESQLSR